MGMVFCRGCGKELHETAITCPQCGAPQRVYKPSADKDDPALKYLVPIGRSGWAIAAGYLGLISVLVVPAPFALACGLMAVRNIRRDDKLIGMGRAVFGIVMGGLVTLVVLYFLIKRI
jgi:hypothetical protein